VNITFSPFYGTASYPTLHAAIHAILNIVGARASLPDYTNTVSKREIRRLHSLGLLLYRVFQAELFPKLHSSAMGSIWTLAEITELDFAATSALLAIKAKQQSISDPQQADADSSDESEPGEDGEDEDAATTKTASELATFPRETLKDKFLDRLAEVFSREKSSAQCRGRRDSSHVAATAWIEADARSGSPLTVIVAKNEGLDDLDQNMSSKLQKWLRAVSVTGRDRTAQTDKLWIGDGGLVDYSRSRVLYHISQIVDEKVTELAKSSTDFAVQITHLQSLCRNVSSGSTVQQLGNAVDVAHQLRFAWKGVTFQPNHMKTVRYINMLGRLRAAYECFKSVALTFDAVSTIQLKPMTPDHHVQISANLFRGSLKRLCRELQLPRSFLENKAAHKYTKASRLHIHAEMQILASLGNNPDWHTRAHPYIGVSKRLCFLCSQILRNYSTLSMNGARGPRFQTRQCHGKVYPLWTLPQCKNMPYVAKLALTTAITNTYCDIRRTFHEGPVTRPAVPESSAGVTIAGSVSAELAAVKERFYTKSRNSRFPERVAPSQKLIKLGWKVKTVNVGRLPADGSSPVLVAVDFHKLPDKGYQSMREVVGNLVPDFHSYWREHQFDRRFHNWTFSDQPSEDSNGEYRLYWNENFELCENQSVKRLLKEELQDINVMRRFWYGDVFLVRFSEHPKTYDYDVHDVPASSLHGQALGAIFRHMWKEKSMEAELETDRSLGEHQEKFEADKAIIWQRMLVVLTHNSA
jgi:hypothetical protein